MMAMDIHKNYNGIKKMSICFNGGHIGGSDILKKYTPLEKLAFCYIPCRDTVECIFNEKGQIIQINQSENDKHEIEYDRDGNPSKDNFISDDDRMMQSVIIRKDKSEIFNNLIDPNLPEHYKDAHEQVQYFLCTKYLNDKTQDHFNKLEGFVNGASTSFCTFLIYKNHDKIIIKQLYCRF